MGTYDILAELADRLANKRRTRPLVLFVGTGVTIYLTELEEYVPRGWTTWAGLSLAMQEELGLTNQVEALRRSTRAGLEHEFGYMSVLARENDQYYKALRELFWTDPGQASIAAILHSIQTGRGRHRWQMVKRLLSYVDGVVTTNYDPLLAQMTKELSGTEVWHSPDYVPWHSQLRRSILDDLLAVPSDAKRLVYLHGGIPLAAHDDADRVLEAVKDFVLDYHSYVHAYPPIEKSVGESRGQARASIPRSSFLIDLARTCDLVFIGHNISDYLLRTAITFGLLTQVGSPSSLDSPLHVALMNQEVEHPGHTGVLSADYLPLAMKAVIEQQYLLRPLFVEELAGAREAEDRFYETPSARAATPSVLPIGAGLDAALKGVFAHIDSDRIRDEKEEIGILIGDAK